MSLMTITEVTKNFNVTTRMLRYYDEIGILPSIRKEDYAYRVYDEVAIRRLQQIITLRKLRIPLKKIAFIFEDPEKMKIIKIFQESIDELDKEMPALQIIRDILSMFIVRINSVADVKVEFDLLDDLEIKNVIQTISLSKTNFKEERSMDDLNKATENLGVLKNVRILYIPPCTVASSHFKGETPELYAQSNLMNFIKQSNLYEIKPDARVFGFNHPNPSNGELNYGYEFWVSIPDDMEVNAPLQKKKFDGGIYAAHCIKMGDFHEWQWLNRWADNNPEYISNYSDKGEEIMDGCLEEHLNYMYNSINNVEKWPNNTQIDLLLPIKVK